MRWVKNAPPAIGRPRARRARRATARTRDHTQDRLFVLLVGACLIAAANTLRGSVAGRLFLPAAPAPATT
jgi:hypothetical protein